MIAAEYAEPETIAEHSEEHLHLPLGLLGFERLKNYSLISQPGEEPFRWLQPQDEPGLAFLVVVPFEVFPEYEPELSDEDVAVLKLDSPADAVLYNIVTLRAGGRATVNLKGPVVVNRHTGCARQVVLTNAVRYSLQHPLPVGE